MNQSSAETQAVLLPDQLSGSSVHLRPVERADFAQIWRWSFDASTWHPLAFRRQLRLFEAYAAELERALLKTMTFLVVPADRTQPAGYVQTYNFDELNEWFFLAAYIEQSVKGPAGGESLALLIDYSFQSLPARKAYRETVVDDLERFQPLASAAFIEEGRFLEHTWAAGAFRDVVRLSTYRHSWENISHQARTLHGNNGRNDLDG